MQAILAYFVTAAGTAAMTQESLVPYAQNPETFDLFVILPDGP